MTTATHDWVSMAERLAEVRRLCPEMRLGQLLATVGSLAEDETGRGLLGTLRTASLRLR